MLDDGYDFSFSGLKTAVVNHVRKHPDVATADVAASFQEAVVDVLVTKARRAAQELGAKGLCLGGGVAANSQLREPAPRRLHGRRPARRSCPAGRCAPTTPPWSRPPPGGGSASDGPSPLDTGADPEPAAAAV